MGSCSSSTSSITPLVFPWPPTATSRPRASDSTVYAVSPRLHAPYTLQSAISVERQVTKSATLSVTYLNSRGFDQLGTINANAPLPGSNLRPNPARGMFTSSFPNRSSASTN